MVASNPISSPVGNQDRGRGSALPHRDPLGELPVPRPVEQHSLHLPEAQSIDAIVSGAHARRSCSEAQRRFWLLDRIDPGSPRLNIAARWRLHGNVSVADIAASFAVIIRRHPALRSQFVEEDGEPWQQVSPTIPFRVPEIDLSGLSLADALIEADRIAQLDARTAFDLTLSPLIRVTFLNLNDSASILLVTAHHIVCDGWSMGILANELGALCAALAAGQPPVLAQLLTVVPGDTRLSPGPMAEHDAYWSRTLHDLKYFELQTDYPRPTVTTLNGDIASRLLGRDLTNSLEQVSRRAGATLFMTTFATLLTLLHRYSGEHDIAVGTQVSGRDDVDREGLVGVFINTIVVRADLSGDPSFGEFLVRIRELLLDVFDHIDMPLDRVIDIVKPHRDPHRSVLFSTNFTFQRAFVIDQIYETFRLSDLPSYSAGAIYDLNFFMVERPEGWRLSCEYRTDLFESATIERLLGHFINLMTAVAGDSSRSLSALDMIDAAEYQQLVFARNADDTEYPRHQTVSDLIDIQTRERPDAIALMFREQQMSYVELDRASNRLARELLSRGLNHAGRVAIGLNRSIDLVVALLAVLKSGAAYVPLDPTYPRARLAQIIEDAEPDFLLTQNVLSGEFPPGNAEIVLVDGDADAIRGRSDSALPSTPDPGDIAYVIYTSGSTGKPKGVQIQHRALTNLLCAMRFRPGLCSQDTFVAVTTICFDIAALELLLPLTVGARLAISEEGQAGDGVELLRLLRRHGATAMQATPVTWQILLAANWRGDPPMKMLCGGEALPRALASELLEYCSDGSSELWNLYGPTETTIWSSVLKVEPGPGFVALGPPIANTQFYVMDAHQRLAPTGVPGELFIGGDGVALGYVNLPEQTQNRFVADPFRSSPSGRLYRTGDVVRIRPEGTLEFLGRADNQVKLRGFRIELGEIEAVLRGQLVVSDCAVVLHPEASGAMAIRAHVVIRADTLVAGAAVIADLALELRAVLPSHMCPSSIVSMAELPRTLNGKIDRAALVAYAHSETRQPLQRPPSTPFEHKLSDIWRSVLGIELIDVDANFFEIGGHSLLAVRLLTRIETGFGRKVSLATMFANPTIAQQANLLEQDESRAFDFRQVVKLQANGGRPPLIAINNTGIYYALSRRLGPDQPFTSLQLFDPALPRAHLPLSFEDIAAEYVQLIRSAQHNGPYSLIGWCVAGSLAFEIACQLVASGLNVQQLIMFDTWVPGHLQRLPWYRALLADYSYRWKLIAADWAKARSGSRWFSEFFENRATVIKLRAWRVKAQSKRIFGPSGAALNPEQYDQWLLQYLQSAADTYEPGYYRGAITLFRSSREPVGRFLDPLMGWGEFAKGGVDVTVIDGDHFSMFQEPSVTQVGKCIDGYRGNGRNAAN